MQHTVVVGCATSTDPFSGLFVNGRQCGTVTHDQQYSVTSIQSNKQERWHWKLEGERVEGSHVPSTVPARERLHSQSGMI